MHLPLLQDMLVLLGFSVIIVFIIQKFKISSIIGFLLTGIIIGPYGLSLVNAVEQVETLSEIGVILLLFVIGMELSIKQLSSIKKTIFIGGAFQIGGTILVASVFYHLLGHHWNESVFVGFLFSLSSTAIVLKTIQDKKEISAPYARNALGILIFQDIIVVPMLLITPLIAGESSNITMSILSLILKSIVVLIVTLISAKYVVPKLMYAIAKTNNKELFLLVTITLCFAIAFLTSIAGLSLALGAFIAGLIISESEYSYQATSIILPFRELFTSFFFISVGMLLNLQFFFKNFFIILLLVFVVLVVKSIIAAIAVAILKYPTKTAILTGLALFQIGEFAFILSKIGVDYHLLSEQTNQYFLSISITSMILTPFIIILSGNIANKFIGVSQKLGLQRNTLNEDEYIVDENLKNHLIIIGYGLNGSNLSKAALASNIPFVVIESDAEKVKSARTKGIPIIFGDAAQEHILEAVNISTARSVVIAISNNYSIKNIIKSIRLLSKSIYLLVRARYIKDTPELIALGVDKVIPEEFETSLQIFNHVLHNFLVPEDEIEQIIEVFRANNYQLLKNNPNRRKTFAPNIDDFNIICLKINSDSNKFLGESLKKIKLRTKYGINILAIKRNEKLLEIIQPSEILKHNDILYIQGNQNDIKEFKKIIS